MILQGSSSLSRRTAPGDFWNTQLQVGSNPQLEEHKTRRARDCLCLSFPIHRRATKATMWDCSADSARSPAPSQR